MSDATQRTLGHEHWSSRIGFLMAAIGSAVGLGNFWKFPYEAGENGGGAFVFVYLLCIVFVGLPVLIAELAIGRHGKMSGPGSYHRIAEAHGATGMWSLAGWLAVLASFLILSFYSVIAGWVMHYVYYAGTGQLAGLSSAEVGDLFGALLGSPWALLLTHALFIVITTAIVSRGVRGGVERASLILMPIFIILLGAMVVYSMVTGSSSEAVTFLFSVDFTKINFEVAIDAVGHAFFSLGVGAALMITYGAYLDDNVSITNNGTLIAIADTGVAIFAGLAIFPIVFAFGLESNQGPGLLFVTLPSAFAEMTYGSFVATFFFVLAFVAALTSAISLLEVCVSRLEETGTFGRTSAAVTIGAAAFLCGLATILSFNVWSDFHPLNAIDMFAGKTIFDLIDFLASNVLLPVGGILAAVFAGWVLTREEARAELGVSDGFPFRVWRFLVRWFAPIAILLVLLGFFGLFNGLLGS